MSGNRQSRLEIQNFGNSASVERGASRRNTLAGVSIDCGQERRVSQGANECSERPGHNLESHVKDRVVMASRLIIEAMRMYGFSGAMPQDDAPSIYGNPALPLLISIYDNVLRVSFTTSAYFFSSFGSVTGGTSSPRLTAGRSPMSSNQRLRAG